jgi:hypothetical protein
MINILYMKLSESRDMSDESGTYIILLKLKTILFTWPKYTYFKMSKWRLSVKKHSRGVIYILRQYSVSKSYSLKLSVIRLYRDIYSFLCNVITFFISISTHLFIHLTFSVSLILQNIWILPTSADNGLE